MERAKPPPTPSAHPLQFDRALQLLAQSGQEPPVGDPHSVAWQQALIIAASVALPFALWWALLAVLRVPSMIAKTPPGLFEYLFLLPSAPIAQGKLLAALAQTLPMTLIGMVLGLALAFALALSSQIWPAIVRAFMPVALVTQTMPLVALTPLLVLMLGRGPAERGNFEDDGISGPGS